MELATAMETADKNTRDPQNGNPNARENPEEQAVNRVTKDPPKVSVTEIRTGTRRDPILAVLSQVIGPITIQMKH